MANLAATYSALGRHADALVLLEKALNIKRCTLSAEDPEICEGAAHFLFWSVIIRFRQHHEQSWAGILLSWEAQRCAGIAEGGARGSAADTARGPS